MNYNFLKRVWPMGLVVCMLLIMTSIPYGANQSTLAGSAPDPTATAPSPPKPNDYVKNVAEYLDYQINIEKNMIRAAGTWPTWGKWITVGRSIYDIAFQAINETGIDAGRNPGMVEVFLKAVVAETSKTMGPIGSPAFGAWDPDKWQNRQVVTPRNWEEVKYYYLLHECSLQAHGTLIWVPTYGVKYLRDLQARGEILLDWCCGNWEGFKPFCGAPTAMPTAIATTTRTPTAPPTQTPGPGTPTAPPAPTSIPTATIVPTVPPTPTPPGPTPPWPPPASHWMWISLLVTGACLFVGFFALKNERTGLAGDIVGVIVVLITCWVGGYWIAHVFGFWSIICGCR